MIGNYNKYLSSVTHDISWPRDKIVSRTLKLLLFCIINFNTLSNYPLYSGLLVIFYSEQYANNI